jgi:dihydroflavonol-4-reductase
VTKVFVTGGTGVIGRALVARLQERGDQVVALARSESSANELTERGVEVARGEAWDESALAEGMSGCTLAFNLAGVNSLCVVDPEPMTRANVDGAVAAVRAAARARVPRLIHSSSAATIGEPTGTVANEWTAHRGFYLSTYERTKTEGERAALSAARAVGQDLVCVNPSSVQGPGRASGTARFLLAFLDGRLKVFVKTYLSMVDIADCIEGHLLAAERGVSGERYLLSGIRLTSDEALTLAAEVTGTEQRARFVPRGLASGAAALAETGARLIGRTPPICREMIRTVLHGHRYDGSRAERELDLHYTPPRETFLRTMQWAKEQGLLRNV